MTILCNGLKDSSDSDGAPRAVNVRGGWKEPESQRRGQQRRGQQQVVYSEQSDIRSGVHDPFARDEGSAESPRSRASGRDGGRRPQQLGKPMVDSSESEEEIKEQQQQQRSQKSDPFARNTDAFARPGGTGANADFDQVERSAPVAYDVDIEPENRSETEAAEAVRIDAVSPSSLHSHGSPSKQNSFSMQERAEEDERIAKEEVAAKRKSDAKERARVRIAQEADAAEAKREAERDLKAHAQRTEQLELNAADILERKAAKDRAKEANREVLAATLSLPATDKAAGGGGGGVSGDGVGGGGGGPDICNKCGDRCEAKLCSGCYAVGYCSPDCQKTDWKKHKKKCKKLAAKLQSQVAKAEEAAKSEEAAKAEEDAPSPDASVSGDANAHAKGDLPSTSAATTYLETAAALQRAEEPDAATRVAAALEDVKSRRLSGQLELRKGDAAGGAFKVPAAGPDEEGAANVGSSDTSRIVGDAAAIIRGAISEFTEAGEQSQSATPDVSQQHQDNDKNGSDDEATKVIGAAAAAIATATTAAAAATEAIADTDAKITAKNAAKAEATAAKQAARQEAQAARKAKKDAAKATKEERRRSKATNDGNERCPDCHTKKAWCMCEKKRGFAADQKGENVKGFEKLQEDERTNALLDSDADSEDAKSMLDEQTTKEGEKSRRWSHASGNGRSILGKKKEKGSKKKKKKKSRGSNGGGVNGDDDGSGTDWGDSDDSEDHIAKANPSSDHMNEFRRQLAGDVDEDESKKDLASLKQLKSDDPNARCPRCHTKMAWCVCMDRKPSQTGKGGKNGSAGISIDIAGMDDVDSTTDPSSDRVLNLANTVRETSTDASPEKADDPKASLRRPEPAKTVLPELAADLAKQDFKSGPNVWDQEDDEDGDSNNNNSINSAATRGTVLSGSKDGMDKFFREAAAGTNPDGTEASLPSHLLSKRTNLGTPSTGGLFVKPAKKSVRQLSDSEDSDGEGEENENTGIATLEKRSGGASGDSDGGSDEGSAVNLVKTAKRESDKLTAGLFSDVPSDRSNMIRRKKDTALPPGMLKKVKTSLSGGMSRAALNRNNRLIDGSDNEEDPSPNIPTLEKGKVVDSIGDSSSAATGAAATGESNVVQYPSYDDIGKRVHVKGYGTGRLEFLGPVKFADKSTGDWCGIVLDEPNGKNDGSVQGTRYGVFFVCCAFSPSPFK